MFTTIINFKTYSEGSAEFARTLATSCQNVANQGGFNILLAPQALDIKELSDHTDLFLLAQHCDASEPGKSTGHITPESLKLAGASGSILNHSEYKLDFDTLKATVERLRENGMMSVICAASVEECKRVAELHPEFIAYEPAAFIGTETSVVDGDTDELIKVLDEIKNIPVLVGAGIKSAHDINVAAELGAAGVLIASHVVKAEDPEKYLTDLLSDVYKQ